MARRALGPATLAAVQAVEGALLEVDRELVIACSGGVDSLALAVAAARLRRSRHLSRSAVVIDHGLQAGSAKAAHGAQRQLESLGYADVRVVGVTVEMHAGTGLEAAARLARYRALAAVAAELDATVLLGHTLDDQAETVLLGLARGSGTRSLAGMPARSGRFLRPLLSLTRETTVAVCREQGLVPWQDPHNTDDSYARSRVRSRVLPMLEAELGPGIAQALARTAQLARDDADLLDSWAAHAFGQGAPPDGELPECAVMADLHPALRSRVLRSWLLRCGVSEVSHGHLRQVEALVVDWHGQRGVSVPGATIIRRGGRLTCSFDRDRGGEGGVAG